MGVLFYRLHQGSPDEVVPATHNVEAAANVTDKKCSVSWKSLSIKCQQVIVYASATVAMFYINVAGFIS